MYRRILATLLTISCLSRAGVVYGQDACETSPALYAAGCKCYGHDRLKKLADGITELQTCRLDLTAKDALIKERLVEHGSATPEMAWWQTPPVLVGGVVVSVSLGAGLAWLVLKH